MEASGARLIPKMRKNVSSQREVIHAHLLAREAPMNVQKFENVRKDIAYPAPSPNTVSPFFGGPCSPSGAPRASCALDKKTCATGLYKGLEKRQEHPCSN